MFRSLLSAKTGICIATAIALQSTMTFSLSTPAQAQVIEMPIGSQGQSHIARPTKGMIEQDVLARFGQPIASTVPVGDPPITRWEYAEFYVFFEYNHVIHSVLKK